MCEASAYFVNEEGKEELLMKSVDVVRPQDDATWFLMNIFGEQKTVKGKIKDMTLVNHKILFE